MSNLVAEPSRLAVLTAREHDVLQWTSEGKTNWEVGQILSCSEGTVKKHLQRTYKKLGVENRMAAANLFKGTTGWHAAAAIAA